MRKQGLSFTSSLLSLQDKQSNVYSATSSAFVCLMLKRLLILILLEQFDLNQ